VLRLSKEPNQRVGRDWSLGTVRRKRDGPCLFAQGCRRAWRQSSFQPCWSGGELDLILREPIRRISSDVVNYDPALQTWSRERLPENDMATLRAFSALTSARRRRAPGRGRGTDYVRLEPDHLDYAPLLRFSVRPGRRNVTDAGTTSARRLSPRQRFLRAAGSSCRRKQQPALHGAPGHDHHRPHGPAARTAPALTTRPTSFERCRSHPGHQSLRLFQQRGNNRCSATAYGAQVSAWLLRTASTAPGVHGPTLLSATAWAATAWASTTSPDQKSPASRGADVQTEQYPTTLSLQLYAVATPAHAACANDLLTVWGCNGRQLFTTDALRGLPLRPLPNAGPCITDAACLSSHFCSQAACPRSPMAGLRGITMPSGCVTSVAATHGCLPGVRGDKPDFWER
jgi:hypothetical protein